MKLMEKTIASETIYDGKIITVKKDNVLLEDGNEAIREIVVHHGGVCIIPITDDNMVYIVRQYRYAFQKVLLEFPAGKLEKDEDPILAAHRELEEEIGVKATELIDIGEMYPSCGYLTEIIHLYVAKGLVRSKQKLDEDEFLDVEKIPFSELEKLVLSGEVKDGKTIVGMFKAKNYLNK